ncbi:MAG: glycosyl hydrolase [Chloroflexi bacterium]|nr:glycosyl hydrolase [Chloroflexota bacterium]
MSRFSSNLLIFLLIIAIQLSACQAQTANPPVSTIIGKNETFQPTVSPTTTPKPPTPDGLFVDTTQNLGTVSQYVYGTNYGPWIAVPAGMISEAKNAGMNIIRFPGGAWGDQNDLREYQIDTFMAFCQMLGAVPSISVRLHNGTPEQAAAMVTYANLTRKYGIKYWSIGNEPDLYSKEINANYDTPEYNRAWRSIALAMKAVDPTILLIGPEVSQFTANPENNKKDSSGRDWMAEFLKINGDIVDVVSIHRYPFPKNPAVSVAINDLRTNASEWTDILHYLKELIHENTGRNIPIAVTEFSTHYNKAIGGDATPDSLYAGIWLGDLLGRFISEDVLIANHWMLTSSGDQGGWGLIGRGELRPAYYAYQMYKMFGKQRYFSSSKDPDVNIYAAKNNPDILTIMVVNLANEDKTLPLNIGGVTSLINTQTWLLDDEHKAEFLSDSTISSNSQIKLPRQSITLYVMKLP